MKTVQSPDPTHFLLFCVKLSPSDVLDLVDQVSLAPGADQAYVAGPRHCNAAITCTLVPSCCTSTLSKPQVDRCGNFVVTSRYVRDPKLVLRNLTGPERWETSVLGPFSISEQQETQLSKNFDTSVA